MSRKDLVAQGEQRRVAIMAFLRAYHAEHGWAPTVQEIADAVGLVSPNSTRNHLLKLAEDGYIKTEPRQARAIALVSPAPDGWTMPEGGSE
jgi:repressor LexA